MQRQPAVSVEVHSSVLQMSKILKIGHKQWQCATLFHSLLCSFYLHATNEPSINGGIVLSPMSTSVKWVVALSLFLLPSSFLPILNFIFSIVRCSLVCDCNTWWKGKQTRKKGKYLYFPCRCCSWYVPNDSLIGTHFISSVTNLTYVFTWVMNVSHAPQQLEMDIHNLWMESNFQHLVAEAVVRRYKCLMTYLRMWNMLKITECK